LVMNNPLVDCGKPLFFPLPTVVDRSSDAATDGWVVSAAVHSLTAMQKEAVVANSRTGRSWRLASDEGAYLAGLDAAPCPLAFFTVGMVSSTLLALQSLAKSRGVALRQLRLIQDNFYTMTGSALQGTMRGGARDVQLTVQAECDCTSAELQALRSEALARSPLSGLMRIAQPSRFALNHNGYAINPLRVAQLETGSTLAPVQDFQDASVAAGSWAELVTRLGMSRKLAHTVTMAGDSLAAEQSRVLHLRGQCAVRVDGLAQVDVEMFNPHGSVFRFLCDPADGIRAPDALSYAAAGIGFCFMTQFGRYAAITRQRLDQYRILQNIRILGDRVAPVATAVFLRSGESDLAAQRMLDMAEQTCFLHALCRETIQTRVFVQCCGSGPLPPIPEPAVA
jgi:hypothetical protein